MLVLVVRAGLPRLGQLGSQMEKLALSKPDIESHLVPYLLDTRRIFDLEQASRTHGNTEVELDLSDPAVCQTPHKSSHSPSL